jgi:hypothetical protein
VSAPAETIAGPAALVSYDEQAAREADTNRTNKRLCANFGAVMIFSVGVVGATPG